MQNYFFTIKGDNIKIDTICIGIKAWFTPHNSNIDHNRYQTVYITIDWFRRPGTASLLILIRYSKCMITSRDAINNRY